MAVVVFECPLDEETICTIEELRKLRHEVLDRQIRNIDSVVQTLLDQGALVEEEKSAYRLVILDELKEKRQEITQRLSDRETIYSDEIELYLDIISSRDESAEA